MTEIDKIKPSFLNQQKI